MREVTDQSFDDEVFKASSEKPVIVDFWAAWCGPCRALSPILEELSEELPDYEFVSVDVDANPNISSNFGIRSIPTVMRFENGEVTKGFLGAQNKTKVKELLNL